MERHCGCGLEDLVLLKCLYYPKWSIEFNQCNPYENPNGMFYREKKNPKIDMKLKELQTVKIIFKKKKRTSLVAQWLRIHLPTQGTCVRVLVQEDPTCRRATKPMHHNYWACALEPASHNYWARMPQLLKPAHLEPMLHNKEKPLQWEARTPQWRVAPARRN